MCVVCVCGGGGGSDFKKLSFPLSLYLCNCHLDRDNNVIFLILNNINQLGFVYYVGSCSIKDVTSEVVSESRGAIL